MEAVYGHRLMAVNPTQAQVHHIAKRYRETAIPDAREVIEALQSLGTEVFMVSGGLIEPVNDFGVWLGVPRDHIFAVDMEYDQLAEGRITRVELELLGEGLRDLVRPTAAALLSGMLLPKEGRSVNWISAPMLAHEQGIITAQVRGLVQLEDFPNLIACRIYWEGAPHSSTPFQQSPVERSGHRTVAGVLFANGEARLVQL